MIIADTHVHIYPCFETNAFLHAAFANLSLAARKEGHNPQDCDYALLLAESKGHTWFEQAAHGIVQENLDWTITPLSDTHALLAQQRSNGAQLFIFAGSQILTREHIEVLALCTHAQIGDGNDLQTTLSLIKKEKGIPVLPWGAGKWLGGRGKRLSHLLHLLSDQSDLSGKSDKSDSALFLGDNGGRSRFFPEPKLFALARKQGIRILAGTDPLPVFQDAARVGSYGMSLEGMLRTSNEPTEKLRSLIRHNECKAIGTRVNPLRFFLNQIRLRIR